MKKFAKIVEAVCYYAQYLQALLDGVETFRKSLKQKGLLPEDENKQVINE